METVTMTIKDSLKSDEAFAAFLRQDADEYQKIRQKTESGLHPPEEMLYDYVLNLLDEKNEKWVMRHISFCGICADTVFNFMRIEDELDEELSEWADHPEEIQKSPLISAVRDTAEKVAKKVKDFIFSPIWEPRWAGQPVTSASIPKQEYTFSMGELGKIIVVCYWRSWHRTNPAYIWVSWKAYTTLPGELYIRFVDPETQEKRYEASLGSKLTGERIFTTGELGFDPSAEKWAISLILAEVK